MKRFYNHFISRGDLCFDIGANQGDYATMFLELGAARVVALEPVEEVFQHLTTRLMPGEKFVAVKAAVSSASGAQELFVGDLPELSSFHQEYKSLYEQQSTTLKFTGRMVQCVTLDQLIAEHGTPGFCKIDTEGHETAVLAGLTKQIPVLSFEFLYPFKEKALECIASIERISPHAVFNYTLFEFFELENSSWMDASTFSNHLKNLPAAYWTGEIFCRML